MNPWVKICANTSLGDARLAAEAGADAVGFVFAEASRRRVTAAEVAAVTPHLPEEVEKIGVFVDASFEQIVSTAQGCGLTGVQLHFNAPAELAARLRERLGPQARIVSVIRFDAAAASGHAALAALLAGDAHIDAVLVDTYAAAAAGGTGVAFDWGRARETLFQGLAARKHLILAGGLDPGNVAEAVQTLHPWGVDVASGVEAAPGRKDPVKVREFIVQARTAFTSRAPACNT
ncbi:MAG: phosphoribosylanthranilate isomerase [Terracidiphilus sp.]